MLIKELVECQIASLQVGVYIELFTYMADVQIENSICTATIQKATDISLRFLYIWRIFSLLLVVVQSIDYEQTVWKE